MRSLAIILIAAVIVAGIFGGHAAVRSIRASLGVRVVRTAQ